MIFNLYPTNINQETTVTINPLPSVAFSAQFATICSGATNIINFVGTPNATVVFWDGTSNQTIVLDNLGKFSFPTLALIADTTYQLISVEANTTPSCLQTLTGTANSATVVQVVIPVATIDKADAQICAGSNALFTVVGSPNATVVYSINGSNLTTLLLDNLGNGLIDTGVLNTTLPVIFTYKLETVAIGGVFPCIKNINGEIKTVTVMPLPFVTIQASSNSMICEGAKAEIIFKGTPNALVLYTINGGANKSITLNSSGDFILSTGIIENDTTIQLISVSTNNLPTCSLILTNSITIIVNKIPNPNLDQDGYICVDAITGLTLKTYSLDTGLSVTDFDYQWYGPNGLIVGATQNFYNASEVGTFYVIITNKTTGCIRKDTAKIIQSIPPKSITAKVVSDYFDENATIIVSALPSGGDYEYALDFGPYQTSNVFTGVSLGTHDVRARDIKACDEASPVLVKVIGYPKFFTPNGDGINDYWNISALNFQSSAKIYIFDRSGKLIKQISSTGLGWDGTFLGKPVAADDYWFTIEYLENNENKIYKAHFTLKR